MDTALERIRNWQPGTTLNLGSLALTELPPLPPTLTSLNCMHNPLRKLPAVLPPGLKELVCHSCELVILPELPPTLELLNCSHNLLCGLPTLPPSLRWLTCSHNEIMLLPPLPPALREMYCDHNQFMVNPQELPATIEFIKIDGRPEEQPAAWPDHVLVEWVPEYDEDDENDENMGDDESTDAGSALSVAAIPRALSSYVATRLLLYAQSQEEVCSILGEPFVKGATAVMPCGHLFTATALATWMETKPGVCPTCRQTGPHTLV